MVTLHDAIKTIQNGVFVFFSKEHKPVSLKKNKKTDLKNRRLFQKLFFLKPNYLSIFFVISLDRTIWNKSRHYQFDWVRAAHLEYMSLVMKKLRIDSFEYVKISVDKKTSFEKWNPCSMYW